MNVKLNTIACEDCLSFLKRLPNDYVHCVVTSPPYWMQRDYDVVGQIGRESNPFDYIEALVNVFSEVKRVLRPDGTLWLNLGDKPASISFGRIKGGELVGLPWRAAIALSEAGWHLICDNIWYARNKMPETTLKRPTRNHEYVFLLSKNEEYFYDAYAIREPNSPGSNRWGKKNPNKKIEQAQGKHGKTSMHNVTMTKKEYEKKYCQSGRNKRSVWDILTAQFEGKHAAVFPEEIPRISIKAGTSEKGCCPKCGSPWERIIDKDRIATRPGNDTKIQGMRPQQYGNRDPQRHVTFYNMVGWKPTCNCGSEDVVPCIVLDPFMGSGTTALVAAKLNRSYIGCDLNPEYCEAARKRVLPFSPHQKRLF